MTTVTKEDPSQPPPRATRRERRRADNSMLAEQKRLVKEKKLGLSKRSLTRTWLEITKQNLTLCLNNRDLVVEAALEEIFAPESTWPEAEIIVEEDDFGNTEYKLKLVDSSQERVRHLTTQMKFRLEEGRGEAFYHIGFEDDGAVAGLERDDMRESLSSLCYMANSLEADVCVVEVGTAGLRRTLKVSITRRIRQKVKMELRIMLFGAAGAGKTTLVDSKARRSHRWCA